MAQLRELLICVRNEGLSEILEGYGRRLDGLNTRRIAAPGAAGAGAIMVTTTFDCTPAQTARLVSGGVAVVVLAAFPGEFERTSYLAAGAHYLLMSTDTPLLEILDLLARGDFGS